MVVQVRAARILPANTVDEHVYEVGSVGVDDKKLDTWLHGSESGRSNGLRVTCSRRRRVAGSRACYAAHRPPMSHCLTEGTIVSRSMMIPTRP